MKIDEVMQYMAETDEPAAKSYALVKALEFHVKHAKAVEFLNATGSVVERESKAITSTAYKIAVEKLCEAESESQMYRNKRSTCDTRFKYWQSTNANRRQGT